MKFNIMLVDPQNYPYAYFLYDFLKLLRYGLESLGHDCTIRRNHLESGRMNIVLGGHLLTSPQHVDMLASHGPYVAIQGEVVTAGGLNNRDNTDHFESVYLPLLRRAAAVWDGTPHNIPQLEELGVAPHLLLGGYHPAMREVIHREKDIDFLYYGSLTPHRQQQLDLLTARGHNVLRVFDETAIFRNDLIARPRVNLCPSQGPAMNQLPWTRICFLLNNRSLVVVEQCRDQQWLDDCFPWAPAEQWVDLCEEALLHPRPVELVDEYCGRFEQIHFVDKLEAVLDSSLSRMAA